MMKAAMMLGICLFAAAVGAQQPPGAIDALDGIDTVVLLEEGKEVFGKQAFRSEHGRFVYLFSSAETKAVFDKAPGKYAIQMGGLCARMGKGATGNPSDYLVHDGKIYIFGSDGCHKAFASAPEKFLPKAASPMPRDAAAAARGKALLDAAVRSIGAGLDDVTSYVESTLELQKRPSGEIKITTRKAWRFPDGARIERSMVRPDGRTVSYGTLLTAGGAWSIGGPKPMPVIVDAVSAFQLDFGRHLVPLLRSRNDAGTQVAALAAGTVDGVAVKRVRLQRGGVDVTLNLDSTGRVHSTTFVDRNGNGEFGEYTVVYGDFRKVDGLLVPFEEKALFNGAPDTYLSRKLDSVLVNSALDPGLFQAAR